MEMEKIVNFKKIFRDEKIRQTKDDNVNRLGTKVKSSKKTFKRTLKHKVSVEDYLFEYENENFDW